MWQRPRARSTVPKLASNKPGNCSLRMIRRGHSGGLTRPRRIARPHRPLVRRQGRKVNPLRPLGSRVRASKAVVQQPASGTFDGAVTWKDVVLLSYYKIIVVAG